MRQCEYCGAYLDPEEVCDCQASILWMPSQTEMTAP